MVETASQIDAAIRPDPDREVALVRPRGAILVSGQPAAGGAAHAVAGRGLHVSSSRCGNFADALDLLATTPALRELGDRMVTHRFAAADLSRAFATAASPDCIKAVVEHDETARRG